MLRRVPIWAISSLILFCSAGLLHSVDAAEAGKGKKPPKPKSEKVKKGSQTPAAETDNGSSNDSSVGNELAARRLLRNAQQLMELKEYERAVNIYQSILDQFPTASVVTQVYLELGRYHINQGREPAKAIPYLEKVKAIEQSLKKGEQLTGEKLDTVLESVYLIGVAHYTLKQYGECFTNLRRIANDHPNSVWANQAYYYMGMAHFLQQNWSSAIRYLGMVGTFVDPDAPTAQTVEAGRRLYVKVADADLPILYRQGHTVELEAKSASGDTQRITLVPLSARQNLFIASVPTEMGTPKPDDGVLQVIGGDNITVSYVDGNTHDGSKDQKRVISVKVVSSASVAYTLATYDGRAKAAYIGQPVHLAVYDADKDAGNDADTVRVRLVSRYLVETEESIDSIVAGGTEDNGPAWRIRDEVTVLLKEQPNNEAGTVFHTGYFVGKCDLRATTNSATIDRTDDVLMCMTGDDVQVTYEDNLHGQGDVIRNVTASITVLGEFQGGVKPEGAEVTEVITRAQKNVIEGQAYLELAKIFDGMGLKDGAKLRVGEGLARADDVIKLKNVPPDMKQQAFKLRWELQLVSGDLAGAKATCTAFTKHFPDSRHADDALITIGDTHLALGEFGPAIRVFQQILKMKSSDAKALALFKIAEATEQGKASLEPAIPHYKKVAEAYPNSPYCGKALGKVIDYYLLNRDFVTANDMLEQIFVDHPDREWLDEMLYNWVLVSYRMGNFRKAHDLCQRLLMDYPDSSFIPKTREHMSQIETKLKNNSAESAGETP